MNCRNAVIVLVLLILAGCERPAGELRLITPAQEVDQQPEALGIVEFE